MMSILRYLSPRPCLGCVRFDVILMPFRIVFSQKREPRFYNFQFSADFFFRMFNAYGNRLSTIFVFKGQDFADADKSGFMWIGLTVFRDLNFTWFFREKYFSDTA